jgi:hypothetical protein
MRRRSRAIISGVSFWVRSINSRWAVSLSQRMFYFLNLLQTVAQQLDAVDKGLLLRQPGRARRRLI